MHAVGLHRPTSWNSVCPNDAVMSRFSYGVQVHTFRAARADGGASAFISRQLTRSTLVALSENEPGCRRKRRAGDGARCAQAQRGRWDKDGMGR
jgi:hypothetical protein